MAAFASSGAPGTRAPDCGDGLPSATHCGDDLALATHCGDGLPSATHLVLDCEFLTEGHAGARTAQVGLALFFQLGSPVCFHHALPALNRFAARRGAGLVRCVAISTATEAFTINTLANTRDLVEGGCTVGDTLRSGIEQFDLDESIAVAFDRFDAGVNPSDVAAVHARAERELAEATEQDPRLRELSPAAHDALLPSIEASVRSRTFEARSFSFNKCRGTPTFILFLNTPERPVLRQWLGRVPDELLVRWIAEAYSAIIARAGAQPNSAAVEATRTQGQHVHFL
ncbi:hypothetical protein T492DRAFT_958571 [Pavlovales sp. CCMP2436]|nr:hypothetical protein T492DRAFT_958571 [Pavlovales sp. CCMP2436]